MNRRSILLAALGTPLLSLSALSATTRMTVAKSPTCGCCSAWIEHIRADGFEVDMRNVSQDELWALKTQLGISSDLASCHTAQIDGYFVEGHVPAADIHRMLTERPDALGLTVPGMPMGSPGMEAGGEVDPYDTLLVKRNGATEVFSRHS